MQISREPCQGRVVHITQKNKSMDESEAELLRVTDLSAEWCCLQEGEFKIWNKNLFKIDGTHTKQGNHTMWWFLMKLSIFHHAWGTVRDKLILLQGVAQMQPRTFTGPWGSNYFFTLGDMLETLSVTNNMLPTFLRSPTEIIWIFRNTEQTIMMLLG